MVPWKNDPCDIAIAFTIAPIGEGDVTRRTLKVVLLFFVGGLASGLLTLALVGLAPWVVWLGVGIIFLFGLALSLAIGCSQRWLSVTAPPTRYIIAALMIGASYIAALWLVLFPVWAFYEKFLSKATPDELSSGAGTAAGFASGLFVAAATSAALIALALKVATRRWDNKVFILMLMSGIAAILLTSVLATALDIRDSIPVLLAVGQPLMATMCGYWLVRANSLSKAD